MAKKICPICNVEVSNPKGVRCDRGHITQVAYPGYWGIVAFVVTLVAVPVARFVNPWFALFLFLALLAIGIKSLLAGLKWRKAVGPVRQLIPYNLGTGVGSLSALAILTIAAYILFHNGP